MEIRKLRFADSPKSNRLLKTLLLILYINLQIRLLFFRFDTLNTFAALNAATINARNVDKIGEFYF